MKQALFILTTLLITHITAVSAFGASLTVNNEIINDAAIFRNNRLLAPVRAVFERVGATVQWDETERQITVKYEDITVNTKIGNNTITVKSIAGEKTVVTEAAPEIVNGVAYVPVAVVTESLGGTVTWDAADKTAHIGFYKYERPFIMHFYGSGFNIGTSAESADKKLKGYDEENLSVYPFKWRTYKPDNSSFALIGVNDGEIAAFYSNSKNTTIADIRPGMSSERLADVLGWVPESADTIVINNEYGKLTIFRNSLDDYKVMAVLAQSHGNTEQTFNFSDNSMQQGSENILFDIMNAERVNNGLSPFIKDEALSTIARSHSSFMSSANSLTHVTNGGDPFDKIARQGVTGYVMASENIGRDSADAIEMFANWMNNKIYQSNILSVNYNYAGIGAWYGDKAHKMYFTAEFIQK